MCCSVCKSQLGNQCQQQNQQDNIDHSDKELAQRPWPRKSIQQGKLGTMRDPLEDHKFRRDKGPHGHRHRSEPSHKVGQPLHQLAWRCWLPEHRRSHPHRLEGLLRLLHRPLGNTCRQDKQYRSSTLPLADRFQKDKELGKAFPQDNSALEDSDHSQQVLLHPQQ